MPTLDIIRAWKDPQFRAGLDHAQQALVPAHPTGLIELDDAYLDAVVGGRPANGTCSLKSRCWNCTGWDGCSV